MKVLFAAAVLISSVQAQASSAEEWLKGLIAADQTTKILVETIAVAQAYEPYAVNCDFKNLKVVSMKADLNSNVFKVEIKCPLADATQSSEAPTVVRVQGYVEDSMIFPTRIEVKKH
jgi:hypothetical protein